nr:DUF2514 family protein [Pseudomonas sp. C2B4]
MIAGALFGAYHHGLSVKDAEWQSAWNDRDARDSQAKAENEAAAREREQAYQQSINKAVLDGQRIIDKATADVATARASSDRLRGAADKLAAQLAASEASGNSCSTAASKATARAVMVLADVFKRAGRRAGDLAEVANQARARGVACEQAYGVVRSN